jgi:hypothetical protein
MIGNRSKKGDHLDPSHDNNASKCGGQVNSDTLHPNAEVARMASGKELDLGGVVQ